MAVLRVFAVQDMKLGAFIFTFNSQTEGAAMRLVQDLKDSAGHPFNKHPEDYTLFEIGSFDEVSGELTGTQLRSVINLAAF